MKPLNLDNRPCSPISSNCVIWQGPDIPCIKLCTGDTVSDVVFKLATELCTIMDTLNITNYDLSCFNLTACPPEDFQALIQFLIDKICQLEGLSPTKSDVSTCPDCVVSVASCFVIGNQTTMQLVDYVTMIGQKVCDIITQISELQNQINDLDVRVTILENTPPPVFTLPSIATNCLQSYIPDSPAAATIDLVLNALVNDGTVGYCALKDATGEPTEISAAVQSQLLCITSLSQPLAALPAITTFGAYYAGTWVQDGDLTTAADAINNLWIALCDIRAFLDNGFSTTVVDAGEGITVTSSTVGNVTTYTVANDYLEYFLATLSIGNTYAPESGVINKKTPSTVNGIPQGQPIFKYTTVTSNGIVVTANATCVDHVPNECLPTFSFGTFDNTTGVFNITDAGTYLINTTIHLKPDSTASSFWSGTGTNISDIGSFQIGITRNNATDMYIAQGQALIPNIDKCVEINASRVLNLSNGSQLMVKALNTTNRDYDGTSYSGADFITFSIVKLRNNVDNITCPSCVPS